MENNIVYVVMTDEPSRGGSIYSIKATKDQALECLKKLQPGAYVISWVLGAEKWDYAY